ncbi:hypothetical protein CAPTEDRAFT_89088 [Capitella teleta]|uniref:Sulfotransferase domain-containing protein n=1 Tax=Capitella teleta TaxID=283909 RepID=X2BAQ2_CAPTE|nr:hypothetical protein CAPTEDRAFT_89088 [Capitella teleta]|eukprot:ELT90113.1 hypothetical protein CAPTEDRAFT_89088 [Capitella teleta]
MTWPTALTVTVVLLSQLLLNALGAALSESSSEQAPDERRVLPQAIVIGVRKCGTRALLEFLGMHPQIKIAPDEVHFFDKDDRYERGLEWYRQQMPMSSPGQLTMEKSPAYFISPTAPGRIQSMNHTVKLLVILRNPITRVISDYTQTFTKKRSRNESCVPIEDLVIDSFSGEVNLRYKPIDISIYHQHWARWMMKFPRHQIHIVDGDRMIVDPLSELIQVERFLGVKPFLTTDNFMFNATRHFYCMRKPGRATEHCLGFSKGRTHPQLKPTVHQKLKDFFRLHNNLFYQLSGREFHWDAT